MKKRMFIGANWKMNEPPAGSCTPDSPYRSTEVTEVCVFPSFIDLHTVHGHGLMTGAQCGHPADAGAYTGDVSMKMLASQHIDAVLCGHSERREHHHESDEQVALQVAAALSAGLIPVLCIGETADQREMGQTEEVLARQLAAAIAPALPHLTPENFIVAYEPLWAISGGDANKPAAKSEDAQKAHRFIRSELPKNLQSVRIIYGGSMKASNAAELLSQPDIDGGLVGGASLKPKEFAAIVDAARN